jgi:hypothetical protein
LSGQKEGNGTVDKEGRPKGKGLKMLAVRDDWDDTIPGRGVRRGRSENDNENEKYAKPRTLKIDGS